MIQARLVILSDFFGAVSDYYKQTCTDSVYSLIVYQRAFRFLLNRK